jgi:hypothetical protein
VPIKFSEHAKEQLKERSISRKRITETIINPDSILTSFKNRRLRQKRFNDRILEVITVSEGSQITVVTIYYLKEK